MNLVSGGSTTRGHQQGCRSESQGPAWSLEDVWTIEVFLSRKFNLVNGPFFISNIQSLFRARAVVRLGSLFQGPRPSAHKLRVAAHYPDNRPGNDLFLHLSSLVSHPSQLSHLQFHSPRTAPLLHLSQLSITYSLAAGALEADLRHTVYLIAQLQMQLHMQRFVAMSLVRGLSLASATPISPGPSLRLLLDILLLSKVMETLWLWFCRTSSFMSSGSSQMELMLGGLTQSSGSGLRGS